MLRKVLDPCATVTSSFQIQRKRKYNDDAQHYDRPHPYNAPKWSYKAQPGMVYDTEIEAGVTTAEKYVTETEEFTKVRRGVSSAVEESEDDPVMDDSE